jgi:hypothetical protein
MCLTFEKVYDIDFKNQDYQIDFWCALTVLKKKYFDFRNQLQVVDSKKTEIIMVDSVASHDTIKLLLKFNCKIFHKWDIRGFPFDGQSLTVTIYNAALDTSKITFVPDDHGIHHKNKVELENGWEPHKYSIATHGIIMLPMNESKRYPCVTFSIDIDRAHKWGLFSKLFVGMYVAFFVAFLALFISLEHHPEPHFGLTVGALFAAIANKYIVESLLPESPFFNLADKLHAITFASITIIILVSVISLIRLDKLKIIKKESIQWMIKYSWLIIIPYVILSIIFIVDAFYHHH